MNDTPYDNIIVRPGLDWNQIQLCLAGLRLVEMDHTDTEEAVWGLALTAARAELIAARSLIERKAIALTVDSQVLDHRVDYKSLAAARYTTPVLRALTDLNSLPGRHGAQGDPATGLDASHETPAGQSPSGDAA